ncbi:MAG: recombinase family protein, partial [Ruminococcus flavefaciens]|nr:recombinase family protein [Ruminococcus flavefaciens]
MPTVTIIKPITENENGVKLRVVAYCIVSSDSADQLNSYMAQMTYYSGKFENSETETLVDLYADEGISGTRDDKRAEFQRLISDCRKGKIDRIYTKSISRFSRNTKDCLKNIRELKALGISVFFEKENLDTAKITDEIMITVLGGLAQEESISISQNMQWSIQKRMQKGTYIASNQPYGYDKINGQLVVNEAEAEIVRRIFDEYLSGFGINSICKNLNSDGLIMAKSGIIWKKKAVRYILTNEKYIGDCLWRKSYTENVFPFKKPKNRGQTEQYYVTGNHEPIISREIFEKVQELMSQKSEYFGNTEFRTYPLSLKIKCGHCGTTYRKKNVNSKCYWVCQKHDYDSELCPYKGIPQSEFYDIFIRMFNKILTNYKEIIVPVQTALQELKVRKFSNNTN